MFNKHFLSLSMLKTVVLLNIFENHIFILFYFLFSFILFYYFIFQNSLMNLWFLWRKFIRTAYIWIRHFCNNIKVFTVTFDQINAYLLNKSIYPQIVLCTVHVMSGQHACWLLFLACFKPVPACFFCRLFLPAPCLCLLVYTVLIKNIYIAPCFSSTTS